MNLLRKLLFPFAIIYGVITSIRNWFYDFGIFRSYSFQIPIIVVGNLSVGGTGKTPQVEYLVRLLKEKYQVAILSRGYKRKSRGFVLADEETNVEVLGDEPFQYHQKFSDVSVAVDTDRKKGIEQLLQINPDLEVIVLDDAYQHRKVKGGFYILLTTYDELFPDDYLLPMGNLRESRSGAQRADMIVVTKCPENMPDDKMEVVKQKIKLKKNQQLFFSKIVYDDYIFNKKNKILADEIKSKPKLLIAGIAKPKLFFDFLKSEEDIILEFPDHHDFTENDLNKINQLANSNIIVTTEKDYVRLAGKLKNNENLYYLPIKNSFFGKEKEFAELVLNFMDIKKWS